MTIAYTPKVNQRTLGAELLIVNEQHTIGITALNTATPNQIRTIEVPLKESPSSVVIPGYTEVTTSPGTTEFVVDYANGRITFDSSQEGNTVFVTYKGRGCEVDAEDINEIQSPLGSIANLAGGLTNGIVHPVNITPNLEDFTFPQNVTITGDLTVNGVTTTVQSTTVTIADNILLLDSNVVGAPTLDSGFQVHRGSSPDVQLIWNETDDAWEMKNTSGTAILEAFNTGNLYVNGSIEFGGLLKPHTDSTTAITLSTAAGSAVVTVDTTDLRVGINAAPVATLHIGGSTLFGLVTATNPGSITQSQLDNNSGIVITTTSAIAVTLPTPTNTTLGRFYTVLHNDTSTGTLSVNSQSVGEGKGVPFMWDGTFWIPVGGSGGFNLIAGDPGSPQQGDTWFDTTTNQFKGYNGTTNVILG